MTVYTIDPLSDPRWAELISRHDSASVFHSPEWLEAIRRTYGYTPVVYTTSPPSSPLSNGIVLCQIRSWLTGRRMVSVPFSDHCEPLLDNETSAAAIVEELRKTVATGKWNFIELRPMSGPPAFDGAVIAPANYLHILDLKPTADELLRRTHKSCIQVPIKRAVRDGVVYESGNSEHLLGAFYRLMLQTRRRHQLPPQPIQWFRNLAECMGDRLQIRVAYANATEIASILTLQHKDTATYKYGCSDKRFSSLGGMQLLMWRLIEESKALGLASLDLGRSDADNPGLITFKDRWGAKSTTLTYLRWSRKIAPDRMRQGPKGAMKHLLTMMPDAVLQGIGRLLYRHVG